MGNRPERLSAMKFNPRKLLKKLDYLPRWAWYLCAFFMAGPFGILGVYLVFHVLNKMAQDYTEEEQHTFASRSRSASAEVYEDDDCLVTDEEDVERRWQQTQASAGKAHSASTSQEDPAAANSDVSAVIREGRDAMRRIRRANDLIPDPQLSAQIDSIEASCGQILTILEQRPQLLPQLRTFLRYYLPAALRLLDARAKLESTANTPKAREVRARISDALGVIDKAFLKQVEALDEYRFIDLESEMDVLRDMLRADGLIEEDEQQADDPFAGVLSQKYGKPTGGH